MEGNQATSSSSAAEENKIIFTFSEFLTRVVKLEELAKLGSRFLVGFQQGLEFLRRPPIDGTSHIIQNIVKAHETERLKSYFQRGCINTHDSIQKLNNINTCLHGLQGHLREARRVLNELDGLMNGVCDALQAIAGTITTVRASSYSCQSPLCQGSEPESADSGEEEIPSVLRGLDDIDYGSLMAVIYSMVKQDLVMQEKIVYSLDLMTPAGALETYCLMWSLRPFVDDDLINQALKHV